MAIALHKRVSADSMLPNRDDWNSIINQEEGEVFILQIIEEILQSSQDVLFEKHIESQVLPFAVQFSKQTLLRILEWGFFGRDEAKILPETWLPDEAASTDSWARASVPVRKAAVAHSLSKRVKDFLKESDQNILDVISDTGENNDQEAYGLANFLLVLATHLSSQQNLSGRTSKSGRYDLMSIKKPSDNSLASSSSKVLISASSILRKEKRPGSTRRNMFFGISDSEPILTPAQVLEKSIQEENRRTITRISNAEKDGRSSEYTYDQEGRLVLLRKISPSKLLTQGVKAQIVHDVIEQTHPKPLIAPAAHRKHNLPDTLPQITYNNLNKFTHASHSQLHMDLGFIEDNSLDIPPLTETIKVSPGVIVREGEFTKAGQFYSKKRELLNINSRNLQPVGEKTKDSEAILAQIISNSKPVIKSIPFPVIHSISHAPES
ncbi:hypothetical protein HK096_003017 [Nowakowskiella sp. JEL0078]|nr:hypothetical protein HK096_003017 [Nowakowskiella sp. JEL0078]